MAHKESSNVYQNGFCNNISIYCLYSQKIRQIKNVTIMDTDCIPKIFSI